MQNTKKRMHEILFPRARLPYATFTAALLCGAIALFSAIKGEAASQSAKKPYVSKNVSTVYKQNVNSGYLSRELIEISERSYEPGEIVEYDYPDIKPVPKVARVNVEQLPEASDRGLASGTSFASGKLPGARQDLKDIYGLRPDEKSENLSAKAPVVKMKTVAAAKKQEQKNIITVSSDKYTNPWAPKTSARRPVRQIASTEEAELLLQDPLDAAMMMDMDGMPAPAPQVMEMNDTMPMMTEPYAIEDQFPAPAMVSPGSAEIGNYAAGIQTPPPSLPTAQSGMPQQSNVVTVPLQIQVSSLPTGELTVQAGEASSVNALAVPTFSGTITRAATPSDLRRDAKAQALETVDLLPPEGMDPNMPLNEIRLNFDPHMTDLSVQNIKWLREFAKKARQSDLPMVEIRMSSLRPDMQAARYDMVIRTLTNNGLYEEQIRPIITERHPDSFIVSMAKKNQSTRLQQLKMDDIYADSDDPFATVW